VNLAGTTLYFTKNVCVGRWTGLAAFNVTSQCANLSASASKIWDDGSAACTDFGKVQSFTVLQGGSGYKIGDGTDNATSFAVGSASSGSGIFGRCIVNQQGAVTGVNLVQQGSLYTTNLGILCPSACTVNNTCTVTGSGSGAVLLPVLQETFASVSAAVWRKSSGSLVLRVRDQVTASTSVTISFAISNFLGPQPAQIVNIMASGGLILPSMRMTAASGTAAPMLISDLIFSQTAVCESSGCAPGGICTCSGSFSNIPTGRQLYVLRGDIQCNGGGGGKYNVTAPNLNSVQAALVQPPSSCQGACDARSPILSAVDVTQAVAGGTLAFGASVDSVGQDLCMAGKHLKVYFTLQYSSS